MGQKSILGCLIVLVGSSLFAQSLDLPPRQPSAPKGTAFALSIAALPLEEREEKIVAEVKAGNVPRFLRKLVPVSVSAGTFRASYFVAPDYLAIGSDDDFFLAPLSPLTALAIKRTQFVPSLKAAPGAKFEVIQLDAGVRVLVDRPEADSVKAVLLVFAEVRLHREPALLDDARRRANRIELGSLAVRDEVLCRVWTVDLAAHGFAAFRCVWTSRPVASARPDHRPLSLRCCSSASGLGRLGASSGSIIRLPRYS
jgi:hypothetical protein